MVLGQKQVPDSIYLTFFTSLKKNHNFLYITL